MTCPTFAGTALPGCFTLTVPSCPTVTPRESGGIVIPDAAAEKPEQGEILAVGSGKVLDNGDTRALEVKVGNKVLFGKYAGTTIKLQGEEYLIMREDDILAILA